jgi:hypothetical protein
MTNFKLAVSAIALSAALFGASVSTVAANEPSGDELRVYPEYLASTGDAYELVISSRENRIVITSFEVNRGNCKLNDVPRLPAILGFGQSVRIGVFQQYVCVPVEVKIGTDRGELVFETKD